MSDIKVLENISLNKKQKLIFKEHYCFKIIFDLTTYYLNKYFITLKRRVINRTVYHQWLETEFFKFVVIPLADVGVTCGASLVLGVLVGEGEDAVVLLVVGGGGQGGAFCDMNLKK